MAWVLLSHHHTGTFAVEASGTRINERKLYQLTMLPFLRSKVDEIAEDNEPLILAM